MEESLEMPYHGGSGNDQYFRLEPGEHVVEIRGTYGSDHMERLQFRTTRGRESPQYGNNTGTDFKAVAPEGKVLHHISGKSDGYLNAIKFFWWDKPEEKFVPNPNVSQMYGPSSGRAFDDGKEAKDMILRHVHLKASSAIDGIQMGYCSPSEPSEIMELDYHGGSGNDQYFRLESGEHITKVDGVYGSDHMEQLKFYTNRGRSQQFGSNSGTSFSAVAPDGMVLRHVSGKSDGYLNAIKFYWGPPLEEKKGSGDGPSGATSELFGPERGDNTWSDTKESNGRIIRTIHLRASAAIDGIQVIYGEKGDPSESVEARYHGGSGTDQYFRLEGGEGIIRVTGTYGTEHMERLQFFTNRGRSSPQFGSNSGTDWEAKAPDGMVLHKISGRSDGYLNAIRFHWRTPIIETLPPPGTITQMYGPLKQGSFNDRNIARETKADGTVVFRHIRRIHCKASNSIDGIQFFYSDPGQREESYETTYHGGSGNDNDFRLEVGEHIVQINLTHSPEHMEKLRFTTNKGRQSSQFGSRGGTDVVVKAPAGMCLDYCCGRSDGYLNAISFYFRKEDDCKDWGVEKTEEELKSLWACPLCTLYNPLTSPTCTACGCSQPEKLAPGAKEEKDVPLDWFESLIDFIVTAGWLVKPSGAPPLKLFKKVKAKYDDLEYEYDLPPEELVSLVARFTPTQDVNLMRIVNKARDNKEPAEEAVDNIFTSPTAALTFGSLTKDQVKLRYYVLDYFNERVRGVLPFVDLSRPDTQSILAAAVRSVRHLLFNSEKNEEWRAAIERSKDNNNGGSIEIDCNMFRANKLWELKRTDFAFRHSYLGQFYRYFAARPEDDRAKAFRVGNGERAWKVKMIGLNSIDAGGPYRDAMEHMCQELHAPVLPLFVPCSNARSNNGEGRDRVVPRPLPARAGERALRLSVYEFIGRLMGLAMRSGNLLALNFPSIVWKHLASQPITHDDVRAIDLLSFQIIDDMREMAAAPGITDSVFDSAMADVKFEVYDATQTSRELIPGGKNVSVTWENKQRFCEALLKFRLTEFEEQCEAMRRGLATVVPIQLLSLYTWQELEAKIAGTTVDVDLLEQATDYKGVNANDPHVKLFWQMMRERFTDEQRSRFISFVWGRSRLPTSLAGFGSERFKITPHGREDSARDVNKMLPITHTCFFSIELPRYTNLDAMTDRMTYAMMTSTEIDGDGAQSHGVVQTDIGDASSGEGSLFQ